VLSSSIQEPTIMLKANTLILLQTAEATWVHV
jgi:hypothetical protein